MISPLNALAMCTNDGVIVAEGMSGCDFDDTWLKHDRFDGIVRYGIANLKDPSKSVPPLFHFLFRRGDKIFVQKNSTDLEEEYNYAQNYDVSYKDEGEKLFNNYDWDGVINYYNTNGINAPWAKYYLGETFSRKAFDSEWQYRICIDYYKKTNTATVPRKTDLLTISQIRSMYMMAYDLFCEYLENGDETYIQQAKLGKESMKLSLETLNDTERDFAIVKQQAQVQWEEYQRRQQAYVDALGAVLGNISRAIAGGSSTTSSGTNAGAVTTSGQNVSSSTSSSDNKVGSIADWEAKKRRAEERLSKAEAKLSVNPNDAVAKSDKSSSEEIIRTCEQALSRLR